MTFKDALLADVAVFLNPTKFGEEMCIDGVITSAVCDWSTQPKGQHMYDTADSWGVNALLATVALAEGVIHTPEPGQSNESERFFLKYCLQKGVIPASSFSPHPHAGF